MQRFCLALTLLVIGCVSASAQSGQVKWRFRMNGMYANARPAVAADGTVYALDVRGTLYALTPEGELKWSAAGAGLGVDVAADGTVYTGNESRITAFNPDGTVKWVFTESPHALSLIGPNVGPDGNVYAVATEGLGVFSLTPQGQLRWSLPEPYNRPVVIVQNVVFGPSHLYFHANNHIEGVTLDGSARFQYVDGLSRQIGDQQPAVGPDGTLYSALQSAYLGAFNQQVSPLWTFSAQLNNTSSAPDVGADGAVYVALNLRELFSLNAGGTQRWHVRAPGIVDFVVPSPRNDLVLGAGVVTYGEPGLLMGFSTTDGALLWQTELPPENGGRIVPYSRPRFSPDGATAYFGTAILGQDPSNEYSYLYAIQTDQASPTPNIPPSVMLSTPNGTNFVAPASVTLNADASDADGTISRVDFYNESILLGTATSSPYNYTLSNVAAGSYTFTAVAFDNAGASTTSGTVTVTVNIAPAPTPTPQPTPVPAPVQLDVSEDFVRQHYRDFLGREPDAEGLAHWTGEIESCGADLGCREVKRINVSAAFFLSIEFQETGYLSYRARKAAFGDIAGKPVPITRAEMLGDMESLASGLVVGPEGWRQKLEQNKQAYFDQLVASARFAAAYPLSMTPAQFVDALNQNAGGALWAAERGALIDDLTSGARTRAQALRAVAEAPDLNAAEKNKAFVLMQFFGYLRRDPDSAPEQNRDFAGYNFWLGKLNEYNGNYVQAEMVKAFISSDEYRRRFGQ